MCLLQRSDGKPRGEADTNLVIAAFLTTCCDDDVIFRVPNEYGAEITPRGSDGGIADVIRWSAPTRTDRQTGHSSGGTE